MDREISPDTFPPRIPDGVKTEASDAKVSSQFVENHIQIGIEALKLIRRNGKSVRHLRFDRRARTYFQECVERCSDGGYKLGIPRKVWAEDSFERA